MTSSADSVITPEAAAALCDAYLNGLVAGDLEALLTLFSPDAVVEDPVGSEPQQGMEALRAFYQIACDSVSEAERVGPPRIAGTGHCLCVHDHHRQCTERHMHRHH